VSVFSDLNNLNDISMDERFTTLCGLTDRGIDTTLRPYIARLSNKLGRTYEDTRSELRTRYDGYHFVKNSTPIYNPFSLLNAFAADPRPVICIGLNFSSTTRGIERWAVKR
jgi:hypothetical protein